MKENTTLAGRSISTDFRTFMRYYIPPGMRKGWRLPSLFGENIQQLLFAEIAGPEDLDLLRRLERNIGGRVRNLMTDGF